MLLIFIVAIFAIVVAWVALFTVARLFVSADVIARAHLGLLRAMVFAFKWGCVLLVGLVVYAIWQAAK